MVQLGHFHSSPYLVVAWVIGKHISKVFKSLLVLPSLGKEVHKHQKFRNRGSVGTRISGSVRKVSFTVLLLHTHVPV